jgi:hypothetical protein
LIELERLLAAGLRIPELKLDDHGAPEKTSNFSAVLPKLMHARLPETRCRLLRGLTTPVASCEMR